MTAATTASPHTRSRSKMAVAPDRTEAPVQGRAYLSVGIAVREARSGIA